MQNSSPHFDPIPGFDNYFDTFAHASVDLDQLGLGAFNNAASFPTAHQMGPFAGYSTEADQTLANFNFDMSSGPSYPTQEFVNPHYLAQASSIHAQQPANSFYGSASWHQQFGGDPAGEMRHADTRVDQDRQPYGNSNTSLRGDYANLQAQPRSPAGRYNAFSGKPEPAFYGSFASQLAERKFNPNDQPSQHADDRSVSSRSDAPETTPSMARPTSPPSPRIPRKKKGQPLTAEEEALRRTAHLERNKTAAEKCRRRSHVKTEDLKARAEMLKKTNQDLCQEAAFLQQEFEQLRQQLARSNSQFQNIVQESDCHNIALPGVRTEAHETLLKEEYELAHSGVLRRMVESNKKCIARIESVERLNRPNDSPSSSSEPASRRGSGDSCEPGQSPNSSISPTNSHGDFPFTMHESVGKKRRLG